MPKEKPDLYMLFDLKPENAVKYLENKGYAITNDWREMWEDAHARAFTISKMTDMQLLKDTKQLLEKSLNEGMSAAQTKREMEKMFRKKGWWGKEILTDENGEEQVRQLGSFRRVKTIYQQNIQSAYNAGRYLKQLQNVDFAPYFQYICVLDGRTRPEHRAMHGKVFRYDDPLWQSMYPPNGWGCRCSVRQLSEKDLKELGVDVENSGDNFYKKEVVINEDTGETKEVGVFKTKDLSGKAISVQTDAGWSSNTGAAAWNIDVLAFNSIKGLPQDVKDRFISEMAQNTLSETVFKNFVKKNIKSGFMSKGLECTVTWIVPEMLKTLEKENIKIKTPIVVLQDDRIGHIIGSAKVEKQKLSQDELLSLYEIINNPDERYYDYTRTNVTGLVYTRNIKNTEKCIKVCVKLNTYNSKIPVNYISTAGIVNKSSFNNGLYKKIE